MEENTDTNEEVNNKKSDKGRNTPIKLDIDRSDSKEIKKDSNKKVLDENKISTEKNIDSKNNIKNDIASLDKNELPQKKAIPIEKKPFQEY